MARERFAQARRFFGMSLYSRSATSPRGLDSPAGGHKGTRPPASRDWSGYAGRHASSFASLEPVTPLAEPEPPEEEEDSAQSKARAMVEKMVANRIARQLGATSPRPKIEMPRQPSLYESLSKTPSLGMSAAMHIAQSVQRGVQPIRRDVKQEVERLKLQLASREAVATAAEQRMLADCMHLSSELREAEALYERASRAEVSGSDLMCSDLQYSRQAEPHERWHGGVIIATNPPLLRLSNELS